MQGQSCPRHQSCDSPGGVRAGGGDSGRVRPLGARGLAGAGKGKERKGGSGAAFQERFGFPKSEAGPALPRPRALERGGFGNCAIHLANKFADQLIPVTAALPEINYSEFKYNHWLIPTGSGPRLAIHPGG